MSRRTLRLNAEHDFNQSFTAGAFRRVQAKRERGEAQAVLSGTGVEDTETRQGPRCPLERS